MTYLFWGKKEGILNHSGFSGTVKNSWLRLGYFWSGKKLPSCLFLLTLTSNLSDSFLRGGSMLLPSTIRRFPKEDKESLCSSQFAFFVRLFFSRLSLASSSIPGKERSVLWSFLQPWYRNIPLHLAISIWRLWHLKIRFWSLPLSITYCLMSATGNTATELKRGIWSWGDGAGRMDWLLGMKNLVERVSKKGFDEKGCGRASSKSRFQKEVGKWVEKFRLLGREGGNWGAELLAALSRQISNTVFACAQLG